MTISVNYQKRKNSHLFSKFETNKQINLSNIQNYIPIYDRFFSLNGTNWNSINLNHPWSIFDIKENKNEYNEHIFHCKLKHISDEKDITDTQKAFIKMAPLLDPFKYLVGKYNHNDCELFNLPTFDKSIKVHSKMLDPNNSSYIDGFFSFLTSKVLHEHQFLHGVDYYGSFLAIKNEYKIDVIDDIEYLVQSDFFNKQKGNLFDIEDYSHLIETSEVKQQKPLKISTSLKSSISVQSIDNDIFEDLFSETPSTMTLNDIKTYGIDLVDITNSNCFDITNQKKTETIKSSSTCSSRTSHTNENDIKDSESLDTGLEEENLNSGSEEENLDTSLEEETLNSGLEEEHNDSEYEDIETETDDSTIEEESLMLTFPKFPVQVICMENCENTFDDLIINDELKVHGYYSA